MPRIRVLADAALAGIGEFYVEPSTTDDGRRFYRAAVVSRSYLGGFTADAMGEWTSSLAEACADAGAARAVFH